MTASAVLDGIRVLDLTSVIMGPNATQVLGDLGADVIKIESAQGDTNRHIGGGPHRELSGIALNINRNKRSAVLDLKSPGGLAALHRVLDTCDVIVTNLRPGPLERLGISYHQLAANHRGLIYCQAQGFRSDSAERDRPAYDDIVQAATGLARLSERTVGETTYLPSIVADKIAGQTIINAVLAALFHRERTGRGQRVEVPMFDAVLAFNLVEHLSRAAVAGEPAGYSRILTTTRGPHRTADGFIAILPYSDEHWRRLFAAVGLEHRLSEPWFADRAQRSINAEEVYGELAAVVAERTTQQWLEICEIHDIPANPVPTLDEILSDPELHRGMIQQADHPVVGAYQVIQPGMILDETPLRVRRPAPLIGEHTKEILREAGYDDPTISALFDSGAAGRPEKDSQ